MFGRHKDDWKNDPLKWHIQFIADLARLLKPDVYVELGVHRAELFNQVLPHAGRLIGVDIDPESGGSMRASQKTRFVCSSTAEFVRELRADPIPIDLLFIDADHSSTSVLQDFHDFFPFVRQRGIILLHDTHPGNSQLVEPGWCGDAYRAVEILQEERGGFEMMTIPVSPGLTMCRKRSVQLAWMEPEEGEA
ncbi:MAG: class I SAM-dependent methyltransferase [Actinomycetia bacterium]|nr:class I SAM-dependent methyltransferase [Actinomycetes bacterium]